MASVLACLDSPEVVGAAIAACQNAQWQDSSTFETSIWSVFTADDIGYLLLAIVGMWSLAWVVRVVKGMIQSS